MVALSALWLPILLSAVVVFITSSIIHMATPWHKNDYSKAPDAAWEFVKHQSSPEGALFFTKLSKSSVALVRPDILGDPFFADPNFEPYKETLLRAMPNVVPANARGTELQDAFAQSFSLVYLGKVGFDQGVKDLNDALQRVLDKPTT